MKKERILTSACLMNIACRYNGKALALPRLAEWREYFELIPVCPEAMGGLATPRSPVEWRNGKAVTFTGEDKTNEFTVGAKAAVALAKKHACQKAILKECSPSCGCNLIYDGSFTGKKIAGRGIAVAMLRQSGVICKSEEECAIWLDEARNRNGSFRNHFGYAKERD